MARCQVAGAEEGRSGVLAGGGAGGESGRPGGPQRNGLQGRRNGGVAGRRRAGEPRAVRAHGPDHGDHVPAERPAGLRRRERHHPHLERGRRRRGDEAHPVGRPGSLPGRVVGRTGLGWRGRVGGREQAGRRPAEDGEGRAAGADRERTGGQGVDRPVAVRIGRPVPGRPHARRRPRGRHPPVARSGRRPRSPPPVPPPAWRSRRPNGGSRSDGPSRASDCSMPTRAKSF